MAERDSTAQIPGDECALLRSLVPLMRELGVVSAFGVSLGPEPPARVVLERRVAAAQTPEEEAAAKLALGEQARLERIDAERLRVANALGHMPTDAEFERYRSVDHNGWPL